MKKSFLLIYVLMMTFVLSAQAQTSPETKKDVADIRKLYTEAKKEIDGLDKMEREGLPPNKTVFTVTITRQERGRQKR